MEKGAVLLYTQSSLIWVLPTNCEILDARDCVSSLSLSLSLALHSPWHKVDVKYLLEEEMRRRKETGQKGRRKEGERDLCGQMHSRRYRRRDRRDAYAQGCICAPLPGLCRKSAGPGVQRPEPLPRGCCGLAV